MKPVELYLRAMRNSSKKGDVVYEPFSGSGTCVLACEELERRCRAIELSPGYVAVALERWAEMTGKVPELVL
jgi:DNA modification methylase